MGIRKLVRSFLMLLVFITLLAGFVASTVTAVITVMPDGDASRPNRMGYNSTCPFAPISTLILVAIAVPFGIVFAKFTWKRVMWLMRPAREQTTEVGR